MNTAFRLKFGGAFWRRVLRPYLFGKEAEDAHVFTVRTLKRVQENNLLWILRLLYRSPYHEQPIKVFGVPWRNPVGLAAGFDKQGEIVHALEALGFGSIEVGTVTPAPQPGNPRPRVFRYPNLRAAINRYGFNSEGAVAVANHLMASGTINARLKIPIGVSIGKNKETTETDAVKDYLAAFEAVLWVLRSGTDWVKINISSPNTPQLRDTFNRLDEFLDELMTGARRIAAEHLSPLPPFVLKMPPDGLTPEQLEDVVRIAAARGIAGIEATNTTVDERIKRPLGLTEGGGVSGEPLRELADQTLAAMKVAAMRWRIDLVGVGGISEGRHALRKRALGAKAVQLYTGLVFRGPILIHEILTAWR